MLSFPAEIAVMQGQGGAGLFDFEAWKRKVTRIVTPGTLTDAALLDSEADPDLRLLSRLGC